MPSGITLGLDRIMSVTPLKTRPRFQGCDTFRWRHRSLPDRQFHYTNEYEWDCILPQAYCMVTILCGAKFYGSARSLLGIYTHHLRTRTGWSQISEFWRNVRNPFWLVRSGAITRGRENHEYHWIWSDYLSNPRVIPEGIYQVQIQVLFKLPN